MGRVRWDDDEEGVALGGDGRKRCRGAWCSVTKYGAKSEAEWGGDVEIVRA